MIDKNNLPEHWEVKKLGEVADYLNGRAFKPTEWEQAGKPIIRIQNLNKPEANYNYTDEEFEERYKVRKGDLLFAWSASLGAYLWQGNDAWLNQHIFKVVPKSFTDKLYLFYLLEKITLELYAKAHGSGMVHVTKGKFEATEIPLPPFSEQQEIVAKIEELLSELDKGKEQLETARQQLKIYRQAVLKWAFEGRLNHDLKDFPDFLDLKSKEKNLANQDNPKNQGSDNKLTNPEAKEGKLPEGWDLMKFVIYFLELPKMVFINHLQNMVQALELFELMDSMMVKF